MGGLVDTLFNKETGGASTATKKEAATQARAGATTTERVDTKVQTQAGQQLKTADITSKQTQKVAGQQATTGKTTGTTATTTTGDVQKATTSETQQTGTESTVGELRLLSETTTGQLEGLVTDLSNIAGLEGGFANPQLLADLEGIVGEIRTRSAGIGDTVGTAAEAAKEAEILSFERDILPQVSAVGQQIGSRDNSDFARIANRAREDLSIRLNKIGTDALVRAEELGLSGLTSAGELARGGIDTTVNARATPISNIAEIANIIRGAVATQTTTLDRANQTTGAATETEQQVARTDTQQLAESISNLTSLTEGETSNVQKVVEDISTLQELQSTDVSSEQILSKLQEILAGETTETGTVTSKSKPSIIENIGSFFDVFS